MSKELDDLTYGRLQRLCTEGDDLSANKLYVQAQQKYNEALRLIPQPNIEWDASTWVLAAISDTYFYMGNFLKMQEYLLAAMKCPGALDSPILHLRLGQSLYELGDIAKSAKELAKAYKSAGIEIFMEEDPKYLDFLRKKVKKQKAKKLQEQQISQNNHHSAQAERSLVI